MTVAGKHHNSALCHIATALLTRIVSCWRSGQPYLIRDLDGRVLTPDEGRTIVSARYSVGAELRAQRRTSNKPERTGRRSKESQRAPSPDPSQTNNRDVYVA
jgi:hypothetical protein